MNAQHRQRFAAAPMGAAAGVVTVVLLATVAACSNQGGSSPSADTPAPAPTSAAPAIDANAITTITGGKPEVSGNVTKVNFPRTDPPIQIDGWSNVPPFMGLTSYVSFLPLNKGGAMMMGDLVLLEDEVNPAMSAAFDHGLEVTALHNHFFFAKPAVYFMHVGATGAVDQIATGVKATLDAAHAARAGGAAPRETFGKPLAATPSRIDAAKLDSAFAVKGTAQNGMYKAVFGRNVTSSMCGGCSVGSAMGMNTWAAFAGTDEDAVVDGDFATTEDELQPVLKTLRAGGINIVAIHSHTMGETPRVLFLHYWGRGAAADLAKTVKSAVDKTAWAGRSGTGP